MYLVNFLQAFQEYSMKFGGYLRIIKIIFKYNFSTCDRNQLKDLRLKCIKT